MAYTKDNIKVDIETDERPPSTLLEVLDDALDKPPFWDLPLQPSPPPLQSMSGGFSKIYKGLSGYIRFGDIRGAVLMYMVKTDGILDLKSLKHHDFDYHKQSRASSPRALASIAQYVRVEEKKFTREKFVKATQKLTHKDKDGNGPFLCYDRQKDVYRVLHRSIVLASCVAYSRYFEPLLSICPPEFIALHCRTRRYVSKTFDERICQCELPPYETSNFVQFMVKEVVKGHVHNHAGNINLNDPDFVEYFFIIIQREKLGKDLVTAIDKNSPPGRPRSFIYSIIAQKEPKVNMIPNLKVEYFKHGIDEAWSQNQIVMAAEAACRWGHFEAFEALTRPQGLKGFSLEMLRRAILGENLTIVDWLLRNGSWSQIQLDKALEWACYTGEERAYIALLDLGAKPSQKCIYESGCGGSTDILKYLLQHDLDLESTFIAGPTPLHGAAGKGNLAFAEILLQHGIDVNVVDGKGNTALHLALEGEHEELVEMLLFRGSDPNVKNNKNETPLHIACAKGSYRLFEILLNLGADIHVGDNRGRSLVHMSVIGGNSIIEQQLIESGLEVEPIDNDDNAMIHYYALTGQLQLVEQYIAKYPKDISRVNKFLWSPLLCSVVGGHLDTFAFLFKNAAFERQENCDGKNAATLVEDCKRLLQEGQSTMYLQHFDLTIELSNIDSYAKILNYLQYGTESEPYELAVEIEEFPEYDIYDSLTSSSDSD